MRKRDLIGSGSDEETSKEEDGGGDGKIRRDGATEYDKQRLSRMAENRARMEALGLRKMASSLMAMVDSSQSRTPRNKKSKGKKVKVDEDDDDYRPEDERPPSSSSEEEDDDDNDNDNGDGKFNSKQKSSVSKKAKKKHSNSKKKASVRKVSCNSDYMDEDEALNTAIALSLQESVISESSDMIIGNETKGKKQSHEDSEKKKRKNSFVSRLQMTEDELLVHFYQFDENWNDGISVRDLERVAVQHDFTWTDKELADMIHYFDSNGDGKVSLEDFKKIAMRCKMIKGCEGS